MVGLGDQRLMGSSIKIKQADDVPYVGIHRNKTHGSNSNHRLWTEQKLSEIRILWRKDSQLNFSKLYKKEKYWICINQE